MSLSMVPGTPCDLQVIVPSKGRPEAALELVRAFGDTCRGNTRLVFAVNEDDPRAPGYGVLTHEDSRMHNRVEVCHVPAGNMVEALNMMAAYYTDQVEGQHPFHEPFALGFMGDDHRPRTEGWDVKYVEALQSGVIGFVYGDDGLQHQSLPTQIAIRTDIVKAIGYMAPPVLKHMYVDNAWKALGQTTGLLWYVPSVLVEHMHPLAGKGKWDAVNTAVNDAAFVGEEGVRYRGWIDDPGPQGYLAAVKSLNHLLLQKAVL